MENQDPQEQVPEQVESEQVQPEEPAPVEQTEQPVEQTLSNEEKNYKHLQNWFLRSEINKILSENINKTLLNNILDLGSFEGIGTAYFADNFLDNENSTVTCVHPFLTTNKVDEYSQNNELNFDFNISNCKNSNKIIIQKVTTDIFFENNTKRYNLVYVDGSCKIEFVKILIEKLFQLLENNGIIWINNYNYGKEIYDTILELYHGQYEIIYNKYQLAIKKL
jgi:predicted O-methyltransferase YrrM